jgi:phosphoenolpyruvate synthase/pyruvate phosphate dikinase
MSSTPALRQDFRQVMQRKLDLFLCECWDQGERIELRRVTNGLLAFNPLFVFDSSRQGMDVYYNFTDPLQDPTPLLQTLQKQPEMLFEKKIFESNCKELEVLLEQEASDLQTLFSAIVRLWPAMTIGQLFGNIEIWNPGEELLNHCIYARERADRLIYPAIQRLSKVAMLLPAAQAIPEELRPFIAYNEYLQNTIPTEATLRQRAKRLLYHEGRIMTDRVKYLEAQRVDLTRLETLSDQDDHRSIKGRCAFPGDVQGKVKRIFKIEEMTRMEEGCVLVAPMTVPDLLPAMKQAVAIVTDEGGITCHAAIVAREFHIPCVTGTLIATRELQDGDLVRVDATNGIVTKFG